MDKGGNHGLRTTSLKTIRTNVNYDIQIIKNAVSLNSAPPEVVDHSCSILHVHSFDQMYYDLMAMVKHHKMALYSTPDISLVTNTTQFGLSNNQSFYQLPKQKFPTFSGDITEWQGFEDLFISILLHTTGLSDVEKFEYLKTSLEGEALSLVAHLNLTSNNYNSVWDILRDRYRNKRDLARIHLDALLTPQVVTFNNVASI